MKLIAGVGVLFAALTAQVLYSADVHGGGDVDTLREELELLREELLDEKSVLRRKIYSEVKERNRQIIRLQVEVNKLRADRAYPPQLSRNLREGLLTEKKMREQAGKDLKQLKSAVRLNVATITALQIATALNHTDQGARLSALEKTESECSAICGGMTGVKGDPGQKGDAGLTGLKGDQGLQGSPGQEGLRGLSGVPGLKGDHGVKGRDGHPGSQGPRGLPGIQGLPGVKVEPGQKGDTGLPGVKGEPGQKGDTGLPGVKGEPGQKGDTGLPGVKGEPGQKGDTGLPGVKGEPGQKGDTGLAGVKGEPGLKGSPGQDGLKCDPCMPGLPGPKVEPDKNEENGTHIDPVLPGGLSVPEFRFTRADGLFSERVVIEAGGAAVRDGPRRAWMTTVRTDGLLGADRPVYWETRLDWSPVSDLGSVWLWVGVVGVRREGSNFRIYPGDDDQSWAVRIYYNPSQKRWRYDCRHGGKSIFHSSPVTATSRSVSHRLGLLLDPGAGTLTAVDVNTNSPIYTFSLPTGDAGSQPLVPLVGFGWSYYERRFSLAGVDPSRLPGAVTDLLHN